MASKLNTSEDKIRAALALLVKAKQVTIKTTNKYSIITVINWDKYQSGDGETPSKIPNKPPTNHQQTTTEEEGKERKEVKEPIGFLDFWQAYPRKENKGQARKMWLKHKPELQAVLKAVENQKMTDQWKKDGGKFIPHPATWLNAEAWTNEVDIKKPYRGPSF